MVVSGGGWWWWWWLLCLLICVRLLCNFVLVLSFLLDLMLVLVIVVFPLPRVYFVFGWSG